MSNTYHLNISRREGYKRKLHRSVFLGVRRWFNVYIPSNNFFVLFFLFSLGYILWCNKGHNYFNTNYFLYKLKKIVQ